MSQWHEAHYFRGMKREKEEGNGGCVDEEVLRYYP